MTSIEKALNLLRRYPRVNHFNISDLPKSVPRKYDGLKRKKRGFGHRGMSQFQAWPPLGQLQEKMPFYLSVPHESSYNADSAFRRPLVRLSLLELQRLIDLKRIDPKEPIDVTSICNTKLYKLDVLHERHYGFHLMDDGVDQFVTPINIEVQFASELAIAAIERVGGRITTRFYDLYSLWAMEDPLVFFKRGIPIPKCKLPPQDAIPYYSNPENRGYLANIKDIETCKNWLAQKYGYRLPAESSLSDNNRELMSTTKDPRQIFLGLKAGSLVSLTDETVFNPLPEDLDEYYTY